MAKVKLNPIIEELTGRLGNLVFRRTHTGNVSLIKSPNMSHVQWSPAQEAHRRRFKEAVAYARSAMADPEIRQIYEQMAVEKKKNKRPFDMAVSDYFQGNDLLIKKSPGNRE